MAKDILILSGEELRRLAKLVHHQEAANARKIEFKSEAERLKYLNQSKACYKSAMELLDSGEKLQKEYESSDKRSEVAHQIFSFMEWTVNTSFQFILSYKVRKDCLNSVTKYSENLIHRLKMLDPNDSSGVLKLLTDAKQHEKAMVELAKEQSHPFESIASHLYNKLSTWIKSEKITFERLLSRFKKKLGFEGPFKNLTESQKTQVFEKILETSGRGNVIRAGVARCLGVAGVICLVATAGTMIWDIYSPDHKLQTAMHDTVVVAALVTGVWIGKAVVTKLLADVAVGGYALGPVGAFVGSILMGALLSGLTGWAVDKLFSLFTPKDDHSPVTEPLPQQVVVPMPNTRVIAYKIAHHRKTT